MFIFDRKYGENIALKLDELKALKEKSISAELIISEQQQLINKQKEYITFFNGLKTNLESIISLQNEKINSYQRVEIINNDIKNKLKKETRNKRLWKIVGFSGISTSLILTTILLLK